MQSYKKSRSEAVRMGEGGTRELSRPPGGQGSVDSAGVASGQCQWGACTEWACPTQKQMEKERKRETFLFNRG